jgi:flagellar motor component MotA
MSETILVALLSLAGTVIGTFSGIMTANKLTNYRIEQLEKKVEQHNNLVSRMYEVEKKEALLEEEVEHLQEYHR